MSLSKAYRLDVYAELMRLGARNNIVSRFFPSPHIVKLIGHVDSTTPSVRGGLRRFVTADGLILANALYNRLGFLEPDNKDARRQIKAETLCALTQFARLSLPMHIGSDDEIDCNRVAVFFDLVREGRFCKATCSCCGDSFIRPHDSINNNCIKCKAICISERKIRYAKVG